MNQRGLLAGKLALTGLAWAVIIGCDRGGKPPAQASAKMPTVASLVPAATDLIIGMDAAEHLVAVSDYDQAPQVAKLPRVGAYQTIDWEKLAAIRPNVIVSFYGPGHTPAGFVEKIRELGINRVNVTPDRLDDIYSGIQILGQACGEPAKAAAELKRIREGVDEVRQRVAAEKRERAIVVLSPSATELAGRATFFDDLLQAAGGENAVTAQKYVTLDREALAALRPDVILQLLPGADEKTVVQARAVWASLADLPAVREHRVWIYTDGTIMQPGSHVAEAARKFAEALHPQLPQHQQRKEPASQLSTIPAGS